MIAKQGDRIRFTYPKEPQFNCDLTVVRVDGKHAEDFVYFDDHSHCKQKHLANWQRSSEFKYVFSFMGGEQ